MIDDDALLDWLEGRPDFIRDAADKYPPQWYRTETAEFAMLVSYTEDTDSETCTAATMFVADYGRGPTAGGLVDGILLSALHPVDLDGVPDICKEQFGHYLDGIES